ncbi:S-layer homology domain-containing protein [Halalkalibacter urbisdiaboli]|uniref:S-layer homology domain-containing protein n=1 Tax=Halalkalibacter urbisdiaboli TaxID=1960589 RepID=UPI000B441B22|nr:S-layer homology domain-containing protein [Halalkalibacter urbisdiaboli]
MKKYFCIFITFLVLCVSFNTSFMSAHAETVTESKVFYDLDSVPWAESSIYFLTERGTISGYGNGIFGPNDSITRGQAAALLVRELYPHLIDQSSSSYSSKFSDVDKDHYFIKEISIAAEKGLMGGYTDGTFKPQNPITRAETAVILSKAYVQGYGKKEITFKDLSDVKWAKNGIEELASNNLIAGYSQTEFGPKRNVTRAEFSTFLTRVIKFNPMKFEGTLTGWHTQAGNIATVEINNEKIDIELAGLEPFSVADDEAGIPDIVNKYMEEHFIGKIVRVEIEPYSNRFTVKQRYPVGYLWTIEDDKEELINLVLLKDSFGRLSRDFSVSYKYYYEINKYSRY